MALRCDDFFFDRIKTSLFKFDGTDEVICYYKPKHILEYVLKNEDLTKGKRICQIQSLLTYFVRLGQLVER